jgi:hypothetical protein
MSFLSLGLPIAGAILGLAGRESEPTTSTQTSLPWNVDELRALNAQAQALAAQGITVPPIPQLQGMPDLANTETLNAAIQAAIDPVRKNFFDPGGTMSQIRSDFGNAGQYGGSRQGLATGVAAGRLADTEANIAAQIAQALYGTNLNYNAQRANQADANRVFGFNAATNQAQIPWQNLQNLSGILNASKGGTQTTTTQAPSTPWWQAAAGGALSGVGLGGVLGGGTPTLGSTFNASQLWGGGNWV